MKKSIFLLLLLISFAGNAQLNELNNYCGNTTFDLTPMNAILLSNQNPNDFAVTYHLTQSDAAANSNAIVETTNYQSTSSQQVLFGRLQNLTSGAITIIPFNLIVNTMLNVQMSATLNFPSSNIIAMPSGGQQPYTYQWSYNGTPLTGETGNDVYVLNLPSGTYTVTVTDANGCMGSGTMNSSIPQTINANDDTVFLSNLDGGISPPGVGNILSNDFLNALPVSLNQVALSLIWVSNDGIDLDANGQIHVNTMMSSGTYSLIYQICELNNPNNCDNATVTILVDFCRANTPVIDSIVQPLCNEVNDGIVNLSGLPAVGTWTITLTNENNITTYNGTGETFSIPNLANGLYSLDVLAEDILLAGCYRSYPVWFTIYQNNGLSLDMIGSYVDFNADDITDVGDVINYQFVVTNHSCATTATNVTVTSTELSVSGDPISLQANETNNSAFIGTHVLTQEDITTGMVEKHAKVLGYYGEVFLLSLDSTTVHLNIPDGIKLNAFYDYNTNSIQDDVEPNFTYGEFHYAINGGTANNVSTSNGMHFIYESNATNSYNLSYTINGEFATHYTVNPASYSNITVALGSGITTYNFPITVTPYSDLAVQLYNYSAPPRPGFIYQNYLSYTNYGNQTIASGTVTFVKDPLLTITSISESGAITNANGFAFDFVNLLPNQTRYITVNMQVPTIPTIALGQQLTNSCSISIPANDTNTNNNASSLTQTIVGSYDPNDKSESHSGEVVFSTFSADDYLTYTIRFENTGTANAVNVKVNDVLDSQLDESSMRMLTSSHPFVLKRVNNTLTWDFEGIDLPPTVENDEVTGHGYIVFQVKPKSGFALGDVIPNTANILFDFNPAIVTNTCTTEFVATLGVNAFDADTFEYYPNPTSDIVTFAFKNTSTTIDTIEVMDVLGKTLISKTIHYNNTTIDLSALTTGMYLVTLKANGQTKTVKISKQ